MATQGEYAYFKNIGAAGMRHATHKPWSDSQCGMYLMELGAMLGLMPEGGRLLDMGCGTGWTSVLFAKKGFDVVGQDLVPEAIEAGRRLKQENGLENLDFVVGDYESLRFENEFDVVVFFDCLHHAVDEVEALRSAWRALKPGGICITSEPGRGHERRSAATVEQFGVTERDMHRQRSSAARRRRGSAGSACTRMRNTCTSRCTGAKGAACSASCCGCPACARSSPSPRSCSRSTRPASSC